MYFSKFPKIYYDFDKFGDGERSLQILRDITLNVRVRKAILENITLYDEYDIQDGDTPEIIAEKLYGDPTLHWVLMLVNQRYDYLNDFPIQTSEFNEHVTEVYGSGNEYKVHHYVKDGLIQEAKAYLKIPSSTVLPVNLFKINDFITSASANARIETVDVANLQLTIIVDSGKFIDGESILVRGFRENENTKLIEFDSVFSFTPPANCFTLFQGYSAVDNYQYEFEVNESKRRIKVISSAYISQMIVELNNAFI